MNTTMAEQCAVYVILCLTIAVVVAGNGYQKPRGDESFNVQAEFLTNVTLKCEHPHLEKEDCTFLHWILPDLQVWIGGSGDGFKTLDGWASRGVDTDGQLHIVLLQEEHFGFYYCSLACGGDTGERVTHVVKRAVNSAGPYWGDLWKVYKKATIIGATAAGAFFTLTIVAMIIYYVNYGGDSGESRKNVILSYGKSHAQGEVYYDNTLFTVTQENTQMPGKDYHKTIPAEVTHQTGL